MKIIFNILVSLAIFFLSACNVSEKNKTHTYNRIKIPEDQFPVSFLIHYKLANKDFKDPRKVEQICNLVIDCHTLIKKRHQQDYLIPISSDVVQLIKIKSNNELHEIDGNVFIGHLAEKAKIVLKNISVK